MLFEVHLQYLCFDDDPTFEPAVRKAVERPWMKRRQHLANFFGPKRDNGDPIPLIYFAVQTTDSKILNADGGLDKILAAVRGVHAHLGIDLTQQVLQNNFHQRPQYEGEALTEAGIDGDYGLGVMEEHPCGAPGLATPYLEEQWERWVCRDPRNSEVCGARRRGGGKRASSSGGCARL